MTEPDLRTEATKAKLAERLRAVTVSLQEEPGGDSVTAKFIFDLRAAADALDDTEKLLHLVLSEMAPATNRYLAAGGPVSDGQREIWEQTEQLASAMRKRLDAANPEPQVT